MMKSEGDSLPVGEGSGDAVVTRYCDDTEGYHFHGKRHGTTETIISHINKFYPAYYNHMARSNAEPVHAVAGEFASERERFSWNC